MTILTFKRVYFTEFEGKILKSGLIPYPTSVEGDEETTTVTWETDLEPDRLAEAEIIVASLGTNMDTALFTRIRPDIHNLRSYMVLSSPTAAQTVTALKSTIRVLAALVKDQ